MSAGPFTERVSRALADARLRGALRFTTDRLFRMRRQAMEVLRASAEQGLALGDFERVRARAAAIRQHAVAHLDYYLGQAAEQIQRRGGQVYFARNAEDVGRVVLEIARRRGADLVVKSKSMASEEVHLNQILARAGIEAVESDLGEYIVQLAGETPSHIIIPAIHKTREQVAELFGRVIGHALSADTPTLTAVARQVLREKFLRAGIGVSGANFVVAETGTLVLVTNEGNGRLVSSVPPVHVAIVGIEKVIPTLADLSPLLAVLARSATGQQITTYTHLITGPRRPGELDGPEELHVVFLDNGRSRILGSEYEQVLTCIRCGACLNVCPVYRQIGGHAYGGVYSGPIGAVITPLLGGRQEWSDLPMATSLCGACHEVCPVGIPLHDLLVRLREENVAAGRTEGGERLAMRLLAWAWSRPWAYRLSGRIARWLQRGFFAGSAAGDGCWSERGPGPLAAWAAGRQVPVLAPRSFRELWGDLVAEPAGPAAAVRAAQEQPEQSGASGPDGPGGGR